MCGSPPADRGSTSIPPLGWSVFDERHHVSNMRASSSSVMETPSRDSERRASRHFLRPSGVVTELGQVGCGSSTGRMRTHRTILSRQGHSRGTRSGSRGRSRPRRGKACTNAARLDEQALSRRTSSWGNRHRAPHLARLPHAFCASALWPSGST